MDWNLVAASVSTVAALGSWAAAAQANGAAKSLEKIEQDRRHDELTPDFRIRTERTSRDPDMALLWLKLVGPAGLRYLDRVVVTIRDTVEARIPISPLGPTAEQVADHVFGPYRFRPQIDGFDRTGREVGPISLLVGDEHPPFTLVRTAPPSWSEQSVEGWRAEHQTDPVRLSIECRRTDNYVELWYTRWDVWYDVDSLRD